MRTSWVRGIASLIVSVSCGLAAGQQLHLVQDVNASRADTWWTLVSLGDRVGISAFGESDSLGRHWETDGTPEGTQPLSLQLEGLTWIPTNARSGDWIVVTSESAPRLALYNWRTRELRPLLSAAIDAYDVGGVVFARQFPPHESVRYWRVNPDSIPLLEPIVTGTPAPTADAAVIGRVAYYAVRTGAGTSIQSTLWSYHLDSRVTRSHGQIFSSSYPVRAVGGKIVYLSYNASGQYSISRFDPESGSFDHHILLDRVPNTDIGFDHAFFDRYFVQATISMPGSTLGIPNRAAALYKFDPRIGVLSRVILPRSTTSSWGGAAPIRPVTNGDWAYFVYSTPESGLELFRLHRDAASAEIVADINPGQGGSVSSYSVVTIGMNRVWLRANDGVHGDEPWVVDPSTGRVRLLDINAGPASSDPIMLGAIGDWFFFMADDGVHGRELWRSDGTAEGTAMFLDAYLGTMGTRGADLHVLGHRLVCSGQDQAETRRLFALQDDSLIPLTPPSSPSSYVPPMSLARLGDKLLFQGTLFPPGPSGLAITDGTLANTHSIFPEGALARDTCEDFPDSPVAVMDNGQFVFGRNEGDGCEPWVSDGSIGGASLTRDLHPGSSSVAPGGFVAVGNLVFFRVDADGLGAELWRTDGTAAGTHVVADISPGSASSWPEGMVAANGRLYFHATAPAGKTIFEFDPSTNTLTPLISNLGASPSLYALNVVGERLVFGLIADAQYHGFWSFDLNNHTIRRIADVVPSYPAYETNARFRVQSRQKLLFSAPTDPLAWSSPNGVYAYDAALDRVDTLFQTSPSLSSEAQPNFLGDVRGRTIFKGYTYEHGSEPWLTDGTVDGTRMFLDVIPGAGSSRPRSVATLGDRLYIICTTPEYGEELYWLTLCPADYDLDFAVSIGDLIGFLGAFERGDATADIDDGSGMSDSDGAVTIDDLVHFLRRFEAGC